MLTDDGDIHQGSIYPSLRYNRAAVFEELDRVLARDHLPLDAGNGGENGSIQFLPFNPDHCLESRFGGIKFDGSLSLSLHLISLSTLFTHDSVSVVRCPTNFIPRRGEASSRAKRDGKLIR